MPFYKIKVKMNKTIIASARYGKKKFLKGKTYKIRRKLKLGIAKNLKKDWEEFWDALKKEETGR